MELAIFADMRLRYFMLNKPYGMVSQFKSTYQQPLLKDLLFNFPEGTNAVGRLDADSEGLLLLTNDRSLTKRLLHPDRKHLREYLVYVERTVQPETLAQLNSSMDLLIKRKGIYKTLNSKVEFAQAPLHFNDLGYKEYIPHSWLRFTLTEGKFRQVRKMCAVVNHRCRRLIRTKIEDLELGDLAPGEIKELEQKELFELLRLDS